MNDTKSKTGVLERFFHLSEKGTTPRTEILAGVTTFMTMAYILAVNPMILKDSGMDFGAVFTATAFSSLVATFIMALWAKLPIALAPGMGLNAFFAYTVCIGMGHTWQFALTAVFLEGILFIILSWLRVREAILNCIPPNIKKGISVGIGLFIAFIGLVNSGIVTKPDAPTLLVQIGDMRHGAALVAAIGLLITGLLLARKVRGALLLGIIATTLIGIPLGVTTIPENFQAVSMPPKPHLFAFEFQQIFSKDMMIALLTLLFLDMFDTIGTLIGVATKARMLDSEGRLPNAKQALMADAIGTTVGACLGTSTVTSYIESASGIAEGGRTGLTSLTTGVLFGVALFLSPLFLLIPGAATAPALILVGLFMMTPILEIDFDDVTESIPAFLTMIMMPLTYSISEGIVFGVISFVVLKALTGRVKEVHPVTYAIAAIFVLQFFL